MHDYLLEYFPTGKEREREKEKKRRDNFSQELICSSASSSSCSNRHV